MRTNHKPNLAQMSLEEFFNLFKRFSIVLTSRDLGLEGREYEIIE
ncbi:hypothetical protein [Rhizobium leguminosarum]|nr:hypothetical protein [Rhizobium leguminosarum]